MASASWQGVGSGSSIKENSSSLSSCAEQRDDKGVSRLGQIKNQDSGISQMNREEVRSSV